VYKAIDAVHASGIPSWSLDVISGLPKLNMDSWQYTLQEAVRAQPSHVSVYDLQVCAVDQCYCSPLNAF
jgi:oxygen-independent coproporphyrinogen-3 oxidase